MSLFVRPFIIRSRGSDCSVHTGMPGLQNKWIAKSVCLSPEQDSVTADAREQARYAPGKLKIRFFRTTPGMQQGGGERGWAGMTIDNREQQVEFKSGRETRTGLSYRLQVRSIANISSDCGTVFMPKLSSYLEESI